jgi:putative FmdB family regulatory protein
LKALHPQPSNAMPIYAYKCASCGHAKDVLQKISDDPLTTCPACGAPAFTKQLTAAGFQLKGSGWYVTDFKSGSAPAPSAAPASPADAKPADAKPAETKPAETASAAKPDAATPPAKKTETPSASSGASASR